jgi:hypothetical protein
VPVAMHDWRKGLCACRVPYACMSTMVGFIIGIWVLFGVVVSPVFRAIVPVVTELVLGCVAMELLEARIHHFFPGKHNRFNW